MSQRQSTTDKYFTSMILTHGMQYVMEHAWDGNKLQALTAMYFVARSLDIEGKKTLKKEIALMQRIRAGTDTLNDLVFDELYDTVWTELHEEGYFLMEKMAFPRNPTRGKL